MATLPDDAAKVIRNVNASNEAIEDQRLRARKVIDIAARSTRAAELSAVAARMQPSDTGLRSRLTETGEEMA